MEAADNVVHAYDLNMEMPEAPLTPNDMDLDKPLVSPFTMSRRQSPNPDKALLASPISRKRRRSEERELYTGIPSKRMFTMTEAEILRTYFPDQTTVAVDLAAVEQTVPSTFVASEPGSPDRGMPVPKGSPMISPVLLIPSHRRVVIRDFMRGLVAEALRNCHPTSEVYNETGLGVQIEVRAIGSRGEVQARTVHLEIDSDVAEVIITEEQHLHFALQKLVDNAIKFTESGTITISVKTGGSSQFVEIRVVDTGCGIAEESKSNLFKPHFQEDASISRSRDGLGLSLFNAKAHVRKHLGGDVTLERSDTEGPCKGSEFLIRIPISTVEEGVVETSIVGIASPPPTSPQTAASTPSINFPNTITLEPVTARSIPPPRPFVLKLSAQKRIAFNPNLARDYPLKILIAEDNAINRNVAVGSLKKLGYASENITVAFDGAEAVKQYEASLDKSPTERFDVVLMDVWMPNMDGYEATRKITELATLHGEKIAIVAVTADITGECLDRSKAAGMQGFLAKPYKVLDIERLIIDNFEKGKE